MCVCTTPSLARAPYAQSLGPVDKAEKGVVIEGRPATSLYDKGKNGGLLMISRRNKHTHTHTHTHTRALPDYANCWHRSQSTQAQHDSNFHQLASSGVSIFFFFSVEHSDSVCSLCAVAAAEAAGASPWNNFNSSFSQEITFKDRLPFQIIRCHLFQECLAGATVCGAAHVPTD